MSERICPVKGCNAALGTTRNGDPLVFCAPCYHSLSRVQQVRLWRTYRTWKRLDRQRIRMRAEKLEVPGTLQLAVAVAISEYMDVRNDCIRSLAPPDEELEVAL